VVSFAEPWLLWLLVLPAGAALLVFMRHRRRLELQRRLASPSVWRRLMGGLPATGLYRLLLWCGAAALVVVASSRPQWGELPTEESVRTRDLVVALDVSDSMLCPDLRPSRLGRAVEVVKRLLPRLEGNRVGVVVFAGEAYPLVPLTTDLSAVSAFLDTVAPGMISLPGSNLEQAVAAALRLLPEEGEGRVVVLVSDGENLQGDMAAAAAALGQAGVGVLAAVAGTEAGGPIPVSDEKGAVHYKRDRGGQPVVTRAQREVMAELTRAVFGEVLEVGSKDAVQEVAAAVERLRTREVEQTRRPERVERFPLFLAAAALLLSTSFALSPWRRSAAVLIGLLLVAGPGAAQQSPPPGAAPPAGLVAPAGPGGAVGTEPSGDGQAVVEAQPSWWQRWIPGGARRLARGGLLRWRAGQTQAAGQDFAAARALAPEDPDRLFDLGTALGALGQVEAADPIFEQAQASGATGAAYNAGTASLQHGRAEPAVRWLRQALIADPDDENVKRNYELALRLLEQQQNQDQQQQERQSPQPTPTPSPGGGPPPTPTPDPNRPLYAALEQAEEEARDAMKTPTPQAVQVEQDW
jgi:Ca-activated chloride channel family protein